MKNMELIESRNSMNLPYSLLICNVDFEIVVAFTGLFNRLILLIYESWILYYSIVAFVPAFSLGVVL